MKLRLILVIVPSLIIMPMSIFNAQGQTEKRQIIKRETNKGQENRKFGIKEEDKKIIEKRVALVIGNGGYENGSLANPTNDAKALAQTLREVGFDVQEGINLNKRQMEEQIRVFGTKIKSGGVGLFYFAGHGIQIRDRNYLIPINCVIDKEQDVEYESVDVGRVIAEMEAAENRLNIVILDACRNNPFSRSFRSGNKGLAQVIAPSGTLISYATAPGSVASDNPDGRNGLYTQELLKFIKQPGLEVGKVFRLVRESVEAQSNKQQVPWESSSVKGEFYFVGDSTVKTPTNNAAPTSDTDKESLYWSSIKDSDDPEDYRNYLKIYPNGIFVSIAKSKIKKFEVANKLVNPDTSIKNSIPNSNPNGAKESHNVFVENKLTTKIKVSQGDQINISASGKIILGPVSGAAGPNGLSGVSGEFFKIYNIEPNLNHGALLVRINQNGKEQWIFAGDSLSFIADKSGTLEFLVNDKSLTNNKDHFKVKVDITKSSGSNIAK